MTRNRKVKSEWQKTREQFRLGSTAEYTWNATRPHEHSCCGSKTSWRHRVNCPQVIGDGTLPPEEK